MMKPNRGLQPKISGCCRGKAEIGSGVAPFVEENKEPASADGRIMLEIFLKEFGLISVPTGISGLEFVKFAEKTSGKKYKNPLAIMFGEHRFDLHQHLTISGECEIVCEGDPRGLDVIRHSAAHVMAQAVQNLFDGVKFGIGPSTQDGFYYDFAVNRPFEPDDLVRIEEEMNRIVRENAAFERRELSHDDAVALFQSRGEKYKVELLKDITDPVVSVYQQGSFVDLCRGPHVLNTRFLRTFKVLSSASAYWRGDEHNDILQRLYATAFYTQADLDSYIELREKIRLRDHRKLGKELDLFSIHEDVGAGLIFWHPNGAMIRHLIEEFWRAEHFKRGYQMVYTPHIARERIYETSGHLQNYADSMYAPLLIDEQPYRLKPMNCPGHIKIFQSQLRSYRDLPIRYCELGTVYRFERSGTLHGMLRVRGFTQDDAHVFCTPQQMADEVYQIMDLVDTLMCAFGYSYRIFLATRPEKYLGSEAEWEWSTNALRSALEKWGKPYDIDEGGGVFYAPKIDIKLTDALGREWQGPTIQVDLNLPKRFKVNYIGEDNSEHEVIMIHRAVLGSMERFVGGLIEHVGGAFPMWLAPLQIVTIPIAERHHEYAAGLLKRLSDAGMRVRNDSRNEKMGYKIREAQMQKVPYMLVIGDREAETGQVSVRHRKHGDMGAMSIEAFIARATGEVRDRSQD